ncbi:MAG: helix-turn-helix domain-containing protein [Beijerinckiaceae bacterium]|jgi:IclR family transcriptional regulator, mhp operon transcriptional activator|nr:helix-turn-helix domain-containing protein [Beijerinckiaceae bacterium]
MAKNLENRSLDRGISVLESLAKGGAMSLHQLFLATGLPKSTLRRLLSTLVVRRIVRVGLGDKLYRSNIALPDLRPGDLTPKAARLVELAMPHMIELTGKIGWPSDLHIFAGNRMRVVESTRTLSPFHIHRSPIDITVNIFGSAGGRAYLSALPHSKVEQLVLEIGDDPDNGLVRFGVDPATWFHQLDIVKTAGYAARVPGYGPLEIREEKLRVMAVPLLLDNESVGALTLLWPREYLDYDAFADVYLKDLQATSRRISESLNQAD